MSKIYKNITDLIGGTPLMEVTNIEKALGLKARLLVKLEYFNPAGSVKDRIAKAMIEDAEAKGRLKEQHRDRSRGHSGVEGLPHYPYHAGDHERGAAEHPEGLRRRDRADRRGKGYERRHRKGGRAGRGDPGRLHPGTVRQSG